jgi:hypothetical protein
MNVTASAATYLQRSASRMRESEQLVQELAGLHPILDADGARIAEISVELRRLADEQRREIVPAADHASHKVFIWRQLDVHARRADELAEHGDWARDAFGAELNGILSRGLRVSDYDSALMTLSGDPLPEATRNEPGKPDVGVFTVVALFVGFLALASLVVLLAARGQLRTIALLAIALGFVVQPWRDRIEGLFNPPPARPDPDAPCPGYRRYRVVLTAEVDLLNTHLMAADAASSAPFDHHAAIADLIAILSRMRRIKAPPATKYLHELELQLVSRWLRLIFLSLDGVQPENGILELDTLGKQANAALHALDAQCSGASRTA